jgi:hypothetical protein
MNYAVGLGILLIVVAIVVAVIISINDQSLKWSTVVAAGVAIGVGVLIIYWFSPEVHTCVSNFLAQ